MALASRELFQTVILVRGLPLLIFAPKQEDFRHRYNAFYLYVPVYPNGRMNVEQRSRDWFTGSRAGAGNKLAAGVAARAYRVTSSDA